MWKNGTGRACINNRIFMYVYLTASSKCLSNSWASCWSPPPNWGSLVTRADSSLLGVNTPLSPGINDYTILVSIYTSLNWMFSVISKRRQSDNLEKLFWSDQVRTLTGLPASLSPAPWGKPRIGQSGKIKLRGWPTCARETTSVSRRARPWVMKRTTKKNEKDGKEKKKRFMESKF